MSIEPLYSRYRKRAESLPRRVRWLALVLAPAETSFIVFAAGVLSVAAALGITTGIEKVSTGLSTPPAVIWLLILAFVTEGLALWVKERQETVLIIAVRQLAYRRFRRVLSSANPPGDARGHVLTHPGQISQFGYAVDFAVSTVQIIAFLVASLSLYGASGAAAALIITGLVMVSIRLVTLIGRLWEQYVELEGGRRRWIQRAADSLPRGKNLPSWSSALDRISGIRAEEELLLRKRVRLQVLNGFLERGALTATLAVIAILGAWLWPDAPFGIGIILAARYLYAAVQNNVVNYRVIRLAAPMMRELDRLEALLENSDEQEALPEPPAGSREVVTSSSDRAEALRGRPTPPNASFVPHNPELPHVVLTAWRSTATDRQLARFTALAREFGLSDDVIERFWKDSTTLSSGEKHRAAVAIVLVDEPEWLILDDTFAALDPDTRTAVADVILTRVPHCTLITQSDEYIPSAFHHDSIAACTTSDSPCSAEPTPTTPVNRADGEQLPDPDPTKATFSRSVTLLFGPHVVFTGLGALLLSGANVGFALTIAQSDVLTVDTARLAAIWAVMVLLGSLLFFGTLYRAPISRLTALHERITRRMDRCASPHTSGAVVGRMGEDFSDLQMSIPGALGSVFTVVVQTSLLVGAAVVGAPPLILIAAAVAFLAVLAMRQGSRWIQPASTNAANRRGDFIGAVSAQAGLHTSPVSAGLKRAGEEAYTASETVFVGSSIRTANAYALRSGLIQLLVLSLNISAVVLILVTGESNPIVAPAAVIYFAATVSAGVESTVETLQEVGVLSLTAERVRLLEEFTARRPEPPVRTAELNRVRQALASGHTMIAVIGPTGAGKSVLLDALYGRHRPDEVALIPDTDPFTHDESSSSGLELARTVLREDTVRLLLLDETFKGLSPAEERTEFESLAADLGAQGRQAVVVLHSRSNLDCFDTVVEVR